MSNLYFVDCGKSSHAVEYIGGMPRYEPTRLIALIVADSRGKAKAEAASRFDLQFTEVKRCVCIERNTKSGDKFVTDTDHGDWNKVPDSIWRKLEAA
jgi:hypothetical protein